MPNPALPGAPTSGAVPIDVDLMIEAGDWPDETVLRSAVDSAMSATLAEIGAKSDTATELSIVFTDDNHIQALNAEWRSKDKPTNVLSFPAFPMVRGGKLPPMLGDVILAAETVAREAALEEKPLMHHITHLLVHGLLHLLAYDHETDAEAEEMEAVERRALARLAIPDPYA